MLVSAGGRSVGFRWEIVSDKKDTHGLHCLCLDCRYQCLIEGYVYDFSRHQHIELRGIQVLVELHVRGTGEGNGDAVRHDPVRFQAHFDIGMKVQEGAAGKHLPGRDGIAQNYSLAAVHKLPSVASPDALIAGVPGGDRILGFLQVAYVGPARDPEAPPYFALLPAVHLYRVVGGGAALHQPAVAGFVSRGAGVHD